ncbi:MAG TPA: CoA transferase [Myxococcota bacterium]|nr:CoA transferase [Myxococcota bacterium]
MHRVMEGVRVLEVAEYTFVPAAGAVLADWGADVIKVEHPTRGDAQRGLLVVGGADNRGQINFLMEHANRGKRSIGIDIQSPDGRALLYELAKSSDVFLTNFLPSARQKLEIDVEHLRAVNPKIIYARGSAYGARGPEAGKGGYDSTVFWARAGSGMGCKIPAHSEPPPPPGPAYGDSMGGMTIAGGIAAALFARERTGEPSVVDISLLSTGVWAMGCGLTGAMLAVGGKFKPPTGAIFLNPLVGTYPAKDGFIMLSMLQGHFYWEDLCRHLDRADLITDDRFATADDWKTNSDAVKAELGAIFAQRTVAEWRTRLATVKGQWAPHQNLLMLQSDPQLLANGLVVDVESGDGSTFKLVANPVQFDETPPALRKGPEAGQHTEEILLERGIPWERIAELKKSGSIN